MTTTTKPASTVPGERVDQPPVRLKLPQLELFIDGKWEPAASGETFATEDPATGQSLATVACAGADDADRAVRAARAAFDDGPWPRMRASDRGRVLTRLAQLVDEYSDELVTLESVDGGKPYRATQRQDLPAVIDTLEYYAGWADKVKGDIVPARADALTYILREPVGVVVGIVPWNFPLMNAVWKIAPALTSGCTMILKPSELTPLSALRLGELSLEAGIPPGVLNIVPGYGQGVGEALIRHPGIDKISFTGSPGVGRHIMRTAADHVVRVGLELGGKSPAVVFADADLDRAVRAVASGAYFNAGQVCSACTRVLVEDAGYDEFTAKLIDAAQSLRIGDPMDPDTRMGPIISAKQLKRVSDYVAIGAQEGANVLTGGSRIDRPGYFMQATVLGDVQLGMRVAQEEIFGPVVSVTRFSDEDEAIRAANGTPYSLAAAVWTNDVTRAHRVSKRLRAGTVWVNTYGHTDVRLPWGGTGGDSGVGRDLGEAALANYTEAKAVWINLA